MKVLNTIFDYLSKGNIIVAVLITVISNFVFEMVTSLLNDIIMPLFDSNNNNRSDVDELKDITINFKGKKIMIGSFIRSLIRFIIVFTLILIFVAFIAEYS